MTKVIIESGLLKSQNIIDLCSDVAENFVLMTDSNLVNILGLDLKNAFLNRGLKIQGITFPAGEVFKTRETKVELENSMFNMGLGRDTCVIALGGGTVTDLVGFVAATYCRGVPLIQMPTTLLAMVDASIGGKTGVNLAGAKNFVGAYYPAKYSFMDTRVLKMLSEDEFLNGIAEMLKHGLIADEGYLELLMSKAPYILCHHEHDLKDAIEGSVQIKSRIVQEDKCEETGKRRILNFGHTVAHAIESESAYSISHGKAVAIGCMVEAWMSMELGYLSARDYAVVLQAFEIFDLVPFMENFNIDNLFNRMKMDKKATNQKPRITVLSGIGSTANIDNDYCLQVEESLVKKAFEEYQAKQEVS